MASFSTAFGLCSITDSKGLLGVSGDDEGCAVITLGKSMVIRCRLSDQKQLNSWSTALSKLTSPVVWNAIDENYIGVFDNVYIKQWNKDDPSLEKTKKHKFKNEIHELFVFSKEHILKKPQVIVLFKNGSIRDLESALSNSKEAMKEVIQPQETIESADVVVDNDNRYLVMVTKFENKYRQCYCVQLEEEHFVVTDIVKKIKLRRQGNSLLGFHIVGGDKRSYLLTFWSDGFLYSLPLPLESEKPGVGKYLGAINVVSKKSEVSMQSLGGDRVAIYGTDLSEEGAFLGIYNVKFGVIQAQTSFKMINKPPRMWLIENNLVTVMGQRLVCVPFNLQTETLSALVGSRALHANVKTPSEICTIIPTAVWIEAQGSSDTKPPPENPDYPEKIKEQLETFSSEGWSEFGICQALMTRLIDEKDMDTLSWCLCNFADIPEDHLVRMVRMALGGDPSQEEANCEFVNLVLMTPADNVHLLRNLREQFSFQDCLSLFKYLSELFSEEGEKGDVPVEKSASVLDWTTTLLDAFYQQLILSRDPEVLKLLLGLKEKIEENIFHVRDIKNMMPSVINLKNGKRIERRAMHKKSYYLEKFRLYK